MPGLGQVLEFQDLVWHAWLQQHAGYFEISPWHRTWLQRHAGYFENYPWGPRTQPSMCWMRRNTCTGLAWKGGGLDLNHQPVIKSSYSEDSASKFWLNRSSLKLTRCQQIPCQLLQCQQIKCQQIKCQQIKCQQKIQCQQIHCQQTHCQRPTSKTRPPVTWKHITRVIQFLLVKFWSFGVWFFCFHVFSCILMYFHVFLLATACFLNKS